MVGYARKGLCSCLHAVLWFAPSRRVDIGAGVPANLWTYSLQIRTHRASPPDVGGSKVNRFEGHGRGMPAQCYRTVGFSGSMRYPAAKHADRTENDVPLLLATTSHLVQRQVGTRVRRTTAPPQLRHHDLVEPGSPLQLPALTNIRP